ncbi:lasso RiPP family leader peptide-containing protein [Micromonospora sp. NPDC092111]|uniref:lasso RiPP family leader peptide-containing protein n=1 Tax=Micromonospora sp. NPDC092111 TaxID=3364289 RepID=UPI00382CFE37
MNGHHTGERGRADGVAVDSSRHPYQPPTIQRLGTLAELTRGGTAGPDDGLGGAGGDGSL